MTVRSMICLLLALLSLSVNAATDTPIVYHLPEDSEDYRSNYPVELLRLILAESAPHRKTQALKMTAGQDRVLMLLNDGVIDVFWSGASTFRNQEYRAIEYPIFKGLLGYRLVLVNSESPDILANITTLEGLKAFSVGQGGGWPDSRIYSENGFVVQTATTYIGLFSMLSKKTFRFVPALYCRGMERNRPL